MIILWLTLLQMQDEFATQKDLEKKSGLQDYTLGWRISNCHSCFMAWSSRSFPLSSTGSWVFCNHHLSRNGTKNPNNKATAPPKLFESPCVQARSPFATHFQDASFGRTQEHFATAFHISSFNTFLQRQMVECGQGSESMYKESHHLSRGFEEWGGGALQIICKDHNPLEGKTKISYFCHPP